MRKAMLKVDDSVVPQKVSMGGKEENFETQISGLSFNRRASRISDIQNEYILHEAVIKNDVDTVRAIMKKPVDVNFRNNFGRAPIHWASSRGNIQIMEMLIAAKSNVGARDKYGMRPILMAAWQGHTEAVQLLIKHGADVTVTNNKLFNVLMCAAKNNRLEVVNFVLDNLDGIDLNAVDINQETALYHAAFGGHLEIVERLVHAGAHPTILNKQGWSPLHCACAKGHLDVAYFLLHHGAEIFVQEEEGNTPLHLAVENRQTNIVQLLLEYGCPADLLNDKGLAPLHIACSHGSTGITELLVQYGCDINFRNKIGNTALHNACLSNHAHIVEFLISKAADLDALNNRLQSPMHIAAEQGYTEICKLLLAAGANIEQREQGGKTPLYIAARGSFTAIVDMIIKTIRIEYPDPNNESHSISRRQSRWSQGQEFNLLGKRENNEKFSEVLWKLSHKYLQPGEWKKLAQRWNFTDEQIKAIEHQYTGPSSYKEHCHRMLRIWVDSLPLSVDAVQELTESLIAINKRKAAETILKKMQDPEPTPQNKYCCNKQCILL